MTLLCSPLSFVSYSYLLLQQTYQTVPVLTESVLNYTNAGYGFHKLHLACILDGACVCVVII